MRYAEGQLRRCAVLGGSQKRGRECAVGVWWGWWCGVAVAGPVGVVAGAVAMGGVHTRRH